MATSGTPNEGRDNIIAPRVYSNLQLRLYTNTGDSLDEDTVLADINEPTGTGYASYTLAGTWSSTDGVVTYDDGTPDDPVFQNTGGTNWNLPVVGAFITDGTYVLHFRDGQAANGWPVTMTPNRKIRVDLSSLVA